VIDLRGRVELRGVQVRVRDVPGPGGLILDADRILVQTEPATLLRLSPVIQGVEIDGATLRVGQDAQSGEVNLARLAPSRAAAAQPGAGGQGGGIGVVPSIVLRSSSVELGEHDGSHGPWTTLRRIPVEGEITRIAGEAGTKTLTLRSRGEGAVPAEITGVISPAGELTLTIDGLALDVLEPRAVPSRIRPLVEQLDLRGAIGATRFTYAPNDGVSASVKLLGVEVTLPLSEQPEVDDDLNPLPQSPEQVSKRLRMRETTGELRFSARGLDGTLTGKLEELPYEVQLRVDGAAADAALEITLSTRGFRLEERPAILRYAPGLARKRMAQFGDPTGIVDATVTVLRRVAGGPLAVRGELNLRDASAAFHRFPYRFHDMTGVFTFTEDELAFRDVRGVSREGAKIEASGRISPLTSEAHVLVDVRVTDLPLGEPLAQAMGPRRRIIDELFSAKRQRELVDAGLIIAPARAREARTRLLMLQEQGLGEGAEAVALSRELELPTFEPGGLASVTVHVEREAGPGSIWNDRVEISLPRVGVLPDAVAMPMLAEGVTILKVNERATVSGGVYRGLTGGEATIRAEVDFTKLDDPNLPFVPDILVEGRGIPVDAILLRAIPEGRRRGQERSVKEILRDLRLSGRIDGTVTVGLGDAGETAYRLDLSVQGGQAAPAGVDGVPRVTLENVRGEIDLTQRSLDLDLTGLLDRRDGPAGARARVSLLASMRGLDRDEGSVTTVRATAAGMEAASKIEDLIAPVAPSAAERIGELRTRHKPEGIVDLRSSVVRDATGFVRAEVELTGARALSLDAFGGRLSLDVSEGSAVFIAPPVGPSTLAAPVSDSGEVVLRGLEVALRFEGEPAGVLRVDGRLSGDALPTRENPQPLRLSVRDGLIQSGLVRGALLPRLGETARRLADEARPRGVVDLDLVLEPSGQTWRAQGEIRPRQLAFTREGAAVEFKTITGAIAFEPGKGEIRDLRAEAATFNVRADGSWFLREDEGVSLTTTLSASAQGLSDPLRALLPEGLRETLDQLAVSFDGPLELSGGSVSLATSPQGGLEGAAARATGTLRFAGAGLEAGVSVRHASGVMDYFFDRERRTPGAAAAPPRFDARAVVDRAMLAGVRVTNLRVRAMSDEDGAMVLPLIAADCHGGRLAAVARVAPATEDAAPRRYTLDASLAGVRFASLVTDLRAAGESAEADSAPDGSRGVMDAGLSLTGLLGDEASRQGRGMATIGGGRVVSLPLLVPIIRLTNLQLPVNERLDFAAADFYIEGPRITFEELSASSASVGVYGFGTAMLPDLSLDLRFRTRSRARVFILTDVVEGIRDQLFSISVAGTAREPELSLRPLGQARRLAERAISGLSEEERRLDEIEQRSRGQRVPRRPSTSTETSQPVPTSTDPTWAPPE
jgi:hypothetical protein